MRHMWPRAVNKVGRVIYIAFSWALMRMKGRPEFKFYNQSMASDDEKINIHNISKESLER